ncbi:MAG: CDGSH iron-sulfur domain-containing protein [Gammaproteobacteria bacterium]|jgi:CDGSH-type Zn-finger protein
MEAENRIRVRADGPLLCTGDIAVYAADGRLLERSADLVLCRCGQSGNKPFCDGSHRNSGFHDDGVLGRAQSDAPQAEGGTLEIRVRDNAMLIARGPLILLNADGSVAARRSKAALCRCGHSANKPFCDGSHKDAGFRG